MFAFVILFFLRWFTVLQRFFDNTIFFVIVFVWTIFKRFNCRLTINFFYLINYWGICVLLFNSDDFFVTTFLFYT